MSEIDDALKSKTSISARDSHDFARGAAIPCPSCGVPHVFGGVLDPLLRELDPQLELDVLELGRLVTKLRRVGVLDLFPIEAVAEHLATSPSALMEDGGRMGPKS